MSEEEIRIYLKEMVKYYENINGDDIIAINGALELIDNLQRENENAKWYVHQMTARINEDIADFIDDDKERNKNIIGELKETKKQWRDVEKLLNGESKDKLYNDWRKYGEYE